MLYLCKKVRIMFQDNEYIGFVTYTQGKRNRKIPFGIVSQSYKQKAIVTHYSRKIRKNLIAIEDKRYFSHLGIDIKSISRALYMNIKAARNMPLDNVKHLLQRQIDFNMAISKEGLTNDYGASIGKILLRRDPDSLRIRARASAAAGSDARMNGCELPVVITSGSGNQGITASVPVVVYAHALAAGEEKMLRAVLLSDLVTIYLKQGIGKLSAYCGAISAGCGAGAAIAFLYDCTDDQIEHAVENALAINSGIICDGAKSSCAAKIAMAVEGGLMGVDMSVAERNFAGGDGIVQNTADETIAAVGKIASQGMVETDKEIIDVMLGL